MSRMDVYASRGGRWNRSEGDGDRQTCCTWLVGGVGGEGVVTLQGRDKNFSTQRRGTERDHGENVKASSFHPVFADEMTYRPV